VSTALAEIRSAPGLDAYLDVLESRLERAVEAYREVFRVLRGDAVETPTALDFGWLVATTPLPKLYGEALRVLKVFGRDTFPIERFRSHSIQAFIYDARDQRSSARKHARAALAETEIAHSGMRYHPTFGLVQSPHKKLYDKLRRLAA